MAASHRLGCQTTGGLHDDEGLAALWADLHIDLQNLMCSFLVEGMVQMNVYMAQSNSRCGLLVAPRRPSNCSVAGMALVWVLWCKKLDIFVKF